MFAGIAALYVLLLFAPDQSLQWAASDEACCHIPTIKAIQEEGLRTALADSSRYRSATTPLYHLVMSFMLGRVDPFAIKCAWIVITLIASVLVYLHLCRDPTLQRKRSAAVALTLAFMLSPTVRASALYFVTDGLAVHFAVVALALLQSARAPVRFLWGFGLAALVAAFASFYTRQHYLWAALFVAYVSFTEGDLRVTMASAVTCVLLGRSGPDDFQHLARSYAAARHAHSHDSCVPVDVPERDGPPRVVRGCPSPGWRSGTSGEPTPGPRL